MWDTRVNKLIQHATSPPVSVVELLKNTLIGTEGTLYQLLDTEVKIQKLHRPHFFYLERYNKAIGNIAICEREVNIGEKKFDSRYIRYLAFDRIFHGGKKGGGKNQSRFHQYFQNLFATSNMNPAQPETKPTFYWAFIDPQNLRSFGMNEKFGFQTIGAFRTIAFSRLNPKSTENARKIRAEEKEEVLKEIREFYNGFNLFSDVHLFEDDNYFVLEENGEVIAGIQANPIHWKIKKLPGFKGKILIKALPYTPLLRKLINPKDHRFLATEGLFWKNGHEDKVSQLLEGVLALTKHHSLLIWEDDQSDRIRCLNIHWGLINKMKEDNEVKIVAKFVNMMDDDIAALKNCPKYLSGFDMT